MANRIVATVPGCKVLLRFERSTEAREYHLTQDSAWRRLIQFSVNGNSAEVIQHYPSGAERQVLTAPAPYGRSTLFIGSPSAPVARVNMEVRPEDEGSVYISLQYAGGGNVLVTLNDLAIGDAKLKVENTPHG